MSEAKNGEEVVLKQLGVNRWQLEDGVIISRRERDFMVYDDGSRSVRIPLETISVSGRFGAAVIFGRYLKWSTDESLTEQDIEKIKANITLIGQSTGYLYEFEPD